MDVGRQTCADALHATIFGGHVDTCTECGRKYFCSEIDCQNDGWCVLCRCDAGDFDE